MPNNAAVFLSHSWQEAGHINKRDDGDIEAVAEAYEACGLIGSIDVERASHHAWLMGNNADRAAIQATKSDQNIRSKVWLDLKKFAIVDDMFNNRLHIIRFAGTIGNNCVKFLDNTPWRVGGIDAGRIFKIIRGDKAQ